MFDDYGKTDYRTFRVLKFLKKNNKNILDIYKNDVDNFK